MANTIILDNSWKSKRKPNQTAEMTRKMELGWATFKKLKWVFRNNKPQKYLNTKVFDSFYRTQTWTWPTAFMDRIPKTQRTMERSILNINLKIETTNLWIWRCSPICREAEMDLCRPQCQTARQHVEQGDTRLEPMVVKASERYIPDEETASKEQQD